MIECETSRQDTYNYLYNQLDENLNFSLHLHSSIEYIYVEKGSIELMIDGDTFIIPENHAALILPNQPHAYHTKHYSKSQICIFSTSYIYSFFNQYRLKKAINPVFRFDNCTEINQNLRNKDTNPFMLKSYFYRIVACYTENTEFVARSQKNDEIINNILAYINNNYHLNISLKTLSEALNYSYHYLSNSFKRIFHTNFSHLLNESRINQAQKLLINTDLPVTRIAMNSGYSSLRSFNRNFYLYTKMTPSQFRDAIMKKAEKS